MSLYHKETIFTKDEIWTLINIYFAKRTGHIETIDNLWQVNFVEIQEDIPLLHKLDVPNYEVYRHYFIGYKENSYAMPHRDKDEKGITRLTVLGLSPDLEGGYPIYLQDTTKHGENGYIPIVYTREQEGETRTTKWNTLHGVSKVFEGERIVLVSWYGEKK